MYYSILNSSLHLWFNHELFNAIDISALILQIVINVYIDIHTYVYMKRIYIYMKHIYIYIWNTYTYTYTNIYMYMCTFAQDAWIGAGSGSITHPCNNTTQEGGRACDVLWKATGNKSWYFIQVPQALAWYIYIL